MSRVSGSARDRPGRFRAFRSVPMGEWLRRGNPLQRIFRLVALLVVVTLVVPGTAFAVVLGSFLFLPLPSALPDERTLVAGQISTIYAADGTPVGEFRLSSLAAPIPADQIPETIRDAVVASEDHDFFSHDGVDFEAVARALLHNLTAGRIVEGGSTITQQLVDNLYFEKRERSFFRKAQEAILAAQVERSMSKEEILARYLNAIYLGDSTFGVEAASQSYFRKPASEVTLGEAALLVQAIPAPSLFSPRAAPDVAEQRRQRVLDQMLDNGVATPAEIEAARNEEIEIHPPPGVEGRYPYFQDYVWEYLTRVAGLTPDEILTGGLRIETSVDTGFQEQAQEVIYGALDDPENHPDGALVAVEPQTGFVRALVGGRDWEASEVNLALAPPLRPGTGRQAGSSLKPFVLARAFEAGLSPSTTYSGARCVTISDDYAPCNYGGSSYGNLTLRSATHRSVNTVFAQLIVDVGVEETAEVAHRLGITTLDPDNPEHRKRWGASLALGAWDVSPLDMASAFSVFAARGERQPPTPVVRVTDRDGNVLVDNTDRDPERVLREVVADNVNDVLKGVISSGTGRNADIGRPAAGKTGTEDDHSDVWFVGYTPTLSTAVWIGHKEGQISMTNVPGFGRMTSSVPAALWGDFMEVALRNVEETDFNEPAPLDSLRERALREQRGGFDLGDRRWPRGLPGADPYYEPPPEPEAGTPPDVEPTTTTSSSTSTTSTTQPFNPVTTTTEPDDDDDDDGGGPFG